MNADGSRAAAYGGAMATEGERWTQVELGRLRDARWRPAAMGSFLAAAQRRANLTRRERPAVARQAATWTVAGGAAWAIAARRWPDGSIARAGRRGPSWWAGCALMLDWHLGMLETPDGRRVTLGVADGLSLLRAWLVPAVAQGAAPGLLLLGVATDLADGAVARRTRTTRLGRDLEGLIDACFAAAALRSSVRAGRLSRAPAVLEQGRLLAGGVYASIVYFTAGHAPDRARGRAGRRAAPVRMAGLLAGVLGRRRLADGLLLAGTALALVGFLGSATGAGADRSDRRP